MSFDDALQKKFSKVHSVFDEYSVRDLIKQFDEFQEVAQLDQQSYNTLIVLLKRSKPVVCNEKCIRSHIKGLDKYWRVSEYKPEVVSGRKAQKPNFIDLHVLRGEN